MIAYFDTSGVVPLLIEEPGSDTAGRLWDLADRIVSASLLYPETRASLARAERLGRLSKLELHTGVQEFEGLFAQVDVIGISVGLACRAGELAESRALSGYAAVHLAALEVLGPEDVVLVAAGEDLRAAAFDLGFDVAVLT